MQPPPRGCVLKLKNSDQTNANKAQPPPRGCVLKHLGHTARKRFGQSSRLRAAVC